MIEIKEGENGWKSWERNPPNPSQFVEVVFFNSSKFSPDTIVTAHSAEVLAGVMGDSKPTLWREALLPL